MLLLGLVDGCSLELVFMVGVFPELEIVLGEVAVLGDGIAVELLPHQVPGNGPMDVEDQGSSAARGCSFNLKNVFLQLTSLISLKMVKSPKYAFSYME